MTRTVRRLVMVGLAALGADPCVCAIEPAPATAAHSASACAQGDRSFGSTFAVLEAEGPLERAAVAIGWPDWDGSGREGRVLLVAAKDGRLVRDYALPELRGFGEVFAAAGDVDGDGREDFAVAAVDAEGDERSTVLVHSVESVEPLHVWKAEQLVPHPRVALSPAGDLDADGRADLAYCFGSWDDEQEHVGALVACSGRTGEVLFERTSGRESFHCTRTHAVGDLDGEPCFITGNDHRRGGDPGRIRIVSGASYEVLLLLEPSACRGR